MGIGAGTLAGAAGAAVLGYGIYRMASFARGVVTYRQRAMADTVDVTGSFLTDARSGAPLGRPLSFFRINDEVMGGKSTSSLAPGHLGWLVFSGHISTDGGGFASCRSLGDDAPLGLPARTSALLVDATGDGQIFKSTLHTADSWQMRTPSWSCDMQTVKGERRTHRLPLSAFRPSRQGSVIRDAPPLDPASATGIGFSLSLYNSAGQPNSSFGPGPFELVVHGVSVEQ